MDIVPFLQVVKKLLAHLAPKRVINVVIDILAIAPGRYQVGVSQE